jgi:hypothetical protein
VLRLRGARRDDANGNRWCREQASAAAHHCFDQVDASGDFELFLRQPLGVVSRQALNRSRIFRKCSIAGLSGSLSFASGSNPSLFHICGYLYL